MKSLTVTLCLVAMLVVGTVSADDAAPSDDLSVLGRFVGTWQMKTTVTPTQGAPIENEGTEVRHMSQGGQVLMFENAGQPEFHLLLMSDPASDDFVGVMLTSGASATMTAEWDAETNTMTFHGTYTNGFKYEGTHRFIDDDHAISQGTISTATGEAVVELSIEQEKSDE